MLNTLMIVNRFFLIGSLVLMVSGQNHNRNDNNILLASRLEIPNGYEVVSKPELETIGALEKCDSDPQKVCVPYYRCDGDTNTVIEEDITENPTPNNINTNGFGMIDIRFGANRCEDHLDVCCTRGGQQSPNTDRPPIIRPPSINEEDRPHVPTGDPATNARPCGTSNPNGVDFKITGNTHGETEYGEFPWMIAILRRNYNSDTDQTLAVCGGSLINPSAVLTGAHCVYRFKTSDLKIRAGEWDTQTDKERLPYQERNVANIIIHEDFNEHNLFNDVALLILQDPVQLAPHIGTICLPRTGPELDYDYRQRCFASGWGKDVFGRDGNYQVILKKISLPIVSKPQCQDVLRTTRLGQQFMLHQSFMCAGGEAGIDTCTGDGGSPLVCPKINNPNEFVQVGIVAWGIGCGDHNIPGVYVDVVRFRSWIDNNLQNYNLGCATNYEFY